MDRYVIRTSLSDKSQIQKLPKLPTITKVRKNVTNKKLYDFDENQMIIDAGQKQMGPDRCEICGMVYDPTFGPDVKAHTAYHSKQNLDPRRATFPVSTPSYVVLLQDLPNVCIYKTKPDSSPKLSDSLFSQLFKLMDVEFGTDLGNPSKLITSGHQFFFAVSHKEGRHIVGCVIASAITQCHRYKGQGQMDEKTLPCEIGISRIWVSPNFRKNGIAKMLLEGVRCNFFEGSPVLKNQIAFSDLTTDGSKLAQAYFETCNFLVF